MGHVPQAQPIRLDETAVYRVRLRLQTNANCDLSGCYMAQLDTSPGNP